MIGLQAVEDIAHSGRTSLCGEKVVGIATVGSIASHFLSQIVADYLFSVFEYAHGRGILVADYALGPFMGEIIGIGAECFRKILPCVAQQHAAFAIGIIIKESLEPLAYAVARGDACDSGIHGHGQTALAESPPAQHEERLARRGGYPVGVAAAGVQKLPCALAGIGLREFYEFVFNFKGAERFKTVLVVFIKRIHERY